MAEVKERLVRRQAPPWANTKETLALQDPYFPWAEREFYLDDRSGMLCVCSAKWETTNAGRSAMNQDPKASVYPSETIGLPMAKKVFQVARDRGLCIADAFVTVVGADNLPKKWLDRLANRNIDYWPTPIEDEIDGGLADDEDEPRPPRKRR